MHCTRRDGFGVMHFMQAVADCCRCSLQCEFVGFSSVAS